MKNEVSVEQLMASAAKALNERYKEFAVPNKLDFHGISPSQFLKRSVFDASRASATDTGLQKFQPNGAGTNHFPTSPYKKVLEFVVCPKIPFPQT